MRRIKRKTIWAYLDGEKLVDVVQAALDNNMMVDDLKEALIKENPGQEPQGSGGSNPSRCALEYPKPPRSQSYLRRFFLCYLHSLSIVSCSLSMPFVSSPAPPSWSSYSHFR